MPGERDVSYVPADHPHMVRAKSIGEQRSFNRIHPTGAVIVRAGIILGEGANLSGSMSMHKQSFCLRRFLRVRSGKMYWLCPGCASPALHCEQVALKNARSKGHDLHGADLYLWGHWWCCRSCWYEMILAGIDNIFMAEGCEELFQKRDNL